MIDDQGNVTLYLYDNLNRRFTETKGLTTGTNPLTKAVILGAREIITPTVATINNSAFIPAAQIDTQLSDAKARLDNVEPLFPPLADSIDDNPPTTIVYGYNEEDNLLILEDETTTRSLRNSTQLTVPPRHESFAPGRPTHTLETLDSRRIQLAIPRIPALFFQLSLARPSTTSSTTASHDWCRPPTTTILPIRRMTRSSLTHTIV